MSDWIEFVLLTLLYCGVTFVAGFVVGDWISRRD